MKKLFALLMCVGLVLAVFLLNAIVNSGKTEFCGADIRRNRRIPHTESPRKAAGGAEKALMEKRH